MNEPTLCIADAMLEIKNISDNIDQRMVPCKCGRRTVDTGDTLTQCKCGNVLIYREPINTVCPRCMRRTFGHCPCFMDSQE